MSEQDADFWVDPEMDGVPPVWPVVDGSGDHSRVIAYCPVRADAERIARALQAASPAPAARGEGESRG